MEKVSADGQLAQSFPILEGLHTHDTLVSTELVNFFVIFPIVDRRDQINHLFYLISLLILLRLMGLRWRLNFLNQIDNDL